VSAVGIIGFIGLLAPNIARLTGARTTGDEVLRSMLLGALVLVLADGLALAARSFTRDMVPTGASAALIGAPALILLASGRMRATDHAAYRGPEGARRLWPALLPLLGGGVALLFLGAVLLGPTAGGWSLAGPADLAFSLRWPRAVAALAAGAGMALSGVILQRLLRNPLASPDVIGISSGASLALVGALVLFGTSIHEAGAPVAMLGSLAVLALLIAIGRRNQGAPALVALAGISLAATLDALMQFVLASGGEETYMVVGWLAGTTFRVSGAEALVLLGSVAALAGVAFTLSRWLTLLGAGDAVAGGRGLAVEGARLALLVLAAVLAALVTAMVGPVAFVGLVAPHLAALLGARRAPEQIATALLIGICLFLAADWIGRTALYPRQLPAGAVASMLGGAYLAVLLARRRAVGAA
jgi:ferric hydroxamate transport system permease protein